MRRGKLVIIILASILKTESSTGIRATMCQGKEVTLQVGWSQKASGRSGAWPALEDGEEAGWDHWGRHVMSKGREA